MNNYKENNWRPIQQNPVGQPAGARLAGDNESVLNPPCAVLAHSF